MALELALLGRLALGIHFQIASLLRIGRILPMSSVCQEEELLRLV